MSDSKKSRQEVKMVRFFDDRRVIRIKDEQSGITIQREIMPTASVRRQSEEMVEELDWAVKEEFRLSLKYNLASRPSEIGHPAG